MINVVRNETWMGLKVLISYNWYRYPNGHIELGGQFETENPGVMVPPLSMKWMQVVRAMKRHYQAGRLPKNTALVIFKVSGKVAAQKLLVEMWVAGNKFRTLPYILNKVNTLYGISRWWEHSEFWCQ